jgi:exonuclease SbcC
LKIRNQLQNLDGVSIQFQEVEKNRHRYRRVFLRTRPPRKIRHLSIENKVLKKNIPLSEIELDAAENNLVAAEMAKIDRQELELSRNLFKEKLAELRTENEQLKNEMEEIKSRMDRLRAAGGAECPLCGQPLSEHHRSETSERLEKQGKNKGDRYRANLGDTRLFDGKVLDVGADHQSEIGGSGCCESVKPHRPINRTKAVNQIQIKRWQASESRKLVELQTSQPRKLR